MQIIDEQSFKIILATENQNYRNNLGAKLRFEGFHVELATGGFHTIHLLERFADVNLLIIHENMHDMSAFEIISLARNIRNKTDFPIIFISKDRNEEEVCEIIFVGANDYIVQSTNFGPITDRVRKYFQTLKSHS